MFLKEEKPCSVESKFGAKSDVGEDKPRELKPGAEAVLGEEGVGTGTRRDHPPPQLSPCSNSPHAPASFLQDNLMPLLKNFIRTGRLGGS